MRKFLFIVAFFAMVSFADDVENTATAEGGFVGSGSTPDSVTVLGLKNVKHDTVIMLEGYIIKKLKDGDYTFKDATGKITVDIDTEVFAGRKITKKTKIKIYGEYDKEGKNKIDVDKLEVVEKK